MLLWCESATIEASVIEIKLSSILCLTLGFNGIVLKNDENNTTNKKQEKDKRRSKEQKQTRTKP